MPAHAESCLLLGEAAYALTLRFGIFCFSAVWKLAPKTALCNVLNKYSLMHAFPPTVKSQSVESWLAQRLHGCACSDEISGIMQVAGCNSWPHKKPCTDVGSCNNLLASAVCTHGCGPMPTCCHALPLALSHCLAALRGAQLPPKSLWPHRVQMEPRLQRLQRQGTPGWATRTSCSDASTVCAPLHDSNGGSCLMGCGVCRFRRSPDMLARLDVRLTAWRCLELLQQLSLRQERCRVLHVSVHL